ncbi:50S ribosomal protein L18e [Thermoproteus tenax]|uniref:Large ribosomal subunit protein eL18 n=1 Tax=Thermoproteus tenax (strain ATCC 35583 / DSM 2078 / JCM 9277 / NBRC 100435 / Kra 1) TaxID=768679 RepID=G4RL47_THETK|nr:50S ribosomal protein L18e [Thermoproteus tenax]CCC82292.1 50S ribosomal protein L18e [Thermoproteus tenax Kra 1]
MPPNPTGPTDMRLRTLVRFLRIASRKNDAPIWSYLAELIERPRRRRVAVNIGKVDRLASDGDIVVIPGKLLGAGKLEKRVTVAVLSATKSAAESVLRAGGELVSIPELVRRNPKGSRVKIVI